MPISLDDKFLWPRRLDAAHRLMLADWRFISDDARYHCMAKAQSDESVSRRVTSRHAMRRRRWRIRCIGNVRRRKYKYFNGACSMPGGQTRRRISWPRVTVSLTHASAGQASRYRCPRKRVKTK